MSDDVLPVLRARWSPLVWDESYVLDDAQIRTLLEAARWAPSAGNSQPWAFVVGRRGDPNHRRICARLAGSSRRWAPSASALVVTAYRGLVEGSDLRYSDYAAYDLGQAVAHLTVQAQGMGLATRQFAAFDHAGVGEDFGIADHWVVTTMIAVGRTPGEPEPARDRMPLDAIVLGGPVSQAAE